MCEKYTHCTVVETLTFRHVYSVTYHSRLMYAQKLSRGARGHTGSLPCPRLCFQSTTFKIVRLCCKTGMEIHDDVFFFLFHSYFDFRFFRSQSSVTSGKLVSAEDKVSSLNLNVVLCFYKCIKKKKKECALKYFGLITNLNLF